jgi:RNA polymerase sigma-70 factor, ECF subfamily
MLKARGGGSMAATPAPSRWDLKMQQRLARGEETALGELYDRFASLVHSIAHRVMRDEDTADQITREVFGYIWENPDAFDPKDGTMRSWVAALTQRQAIHRLRHSGADQVRVGGARSAAQLEARVREANTAARADFIRTSMPSSIRATLELAYFQRRDYRQTAAELGLAEDETRRRLRLGLQMLSTAMQPLHSPPPPPSDGVP